MSEIPTPKDEQMTEAKLKTEIVDDLETSNLKDDNLENGIPGIDPDMMAQLEKFQKTDACRRH
jgi:hypothetical protein